MRLADLLNHLCGKGEEACEEFYRGLRLQAEEVYTSLPTRVLQRGKNRPGHTFLITKVAENTPVETIVGLCQLEFDCVL